MRRPLLGRTLRRIADDPDTFYKGSLASDIVSDLQERGRYRSDVLRGSKSDAQFRIMFVIKPICLTIIRLKRLSTQHVISNLNVSR